MKTRVYDIGQLFISLVFCMSMAACNKEDYYEKQFLDNPYQENPTTNGSVNGGGQAGGDSGEDGGAQGGVDSGVNGGGTAGSATTGSSSGGSTGGTDGSTSGGSVTGSTAGGSTTAGATTGATSGGADGSTSGGSTVGGTTGGSTSGGTTGGATTGSTTGSTAGSSTGATSGGSTTGSTTSGSTTGGTTGSTTGSTSGGSTAGSTTGSTTGGSTPVAVEEIFHQSSSQTKKIDIVWIIDNSGSMDDEQNNLGVNFNAFIQDFIAMDVNFKMAITTTDARPDYKGLMVPNSEQRLNSTAAHNNPTRFMNDFKNMVKVGTSGSGNEKGLEASEGFMDRYASSFLRSDAYLAVVILSDEEDQSAKTPAQYTDYLKSFKSQPGLVKVYSIVDKQMSNHGKGVTTGFQRYAQASARTAGTVSDIYDDFHSSLTEMGQSIINLLDSFALASAPISGTLSVRVNGQLTTNYTYDAASHSIKFNSNSVPAVGAEIKVQYMK